MDDRVYGLLRDFPQIFEKPKNTLENFEDDWVVIDVTSDIFENLEGTDNISVESQFLEDLDRFENSMYADVPDLIAGPESTFDFKLPPDIDLSERDLNYIINRKRPSSIYKIKRKIAGSFPGGPGSSVLKGSPVPPPDALAVYLPFHRYPDLWGIYLLDAGVASLAVDIKYLVERLGAVISAYDARRVALIYLFHHEAYHSAVEGFSLRCELPLRKSIYKTGLRRLYTRLFTFGDAHEETLATAYGIRKIRDGLRLPDATHAAVLKALRAYMCLCPPPYKAGIDFIENDKFDELELRFMEEAMRLSSNKTLAPSAWTLGTYLMSPLIQRNKRFSWICDRADFQKKSRLAVHYFRQRDVLSCLQRISDAFVASGGRHHHHLIREFEEEGRKRRLMSPVPSGEIHKGTLGNMLKQLELDLNVEQFRAECRKVGKALS